MYGTPSFNHHGRSRFNHIALTPSLWLLKQFKQHAVGSAYKYTKLYIKLFIYCTQIWAVAGNPRSPWMIKLVLPQKILRFYHINKTTPHTINSIELNPVIVIAIKTYLKRLQSIHSQNTAERSYNKEYTFSAKWLVIFNADVKMNLTNTK